MNLTPFNFSGLKEAISLLKQGGVIAHPADTCYGLAADFTNPVALKRMQNIKGRDGRKPMSLMFPLSMIDQLPRYAKMDDFAKKACEALFPGPVTLLFPKGELIPIWYFQESPLIGIRFFRESLTQQILENFGSPLITSSANFSGEACCLNDEAVVKVFEGAQDKPDLVFEGRIEGNGTPSTVILIENGTAKIVREGPITENDLKKLGITK